MQLTDLPISFYQAPNLPVQTKNRIHIPPIMYATPEIFNVINKVSIGLYMFVQHT